MHLRTLIVAALFLPLAAFARDNDPAVTDGIFLIGYAANLSIGESYIDIINDGAEGAPLAGPGVGTAIGNICASVYTFDPNEEMISCCSCLITPDQVRNLGVNRDLISNTATGVIPGSVTIKIVGSQAGVAGTSTTCSNALANIQGLPAHVIAFGTTLHAEPAGTYATTEKPFISSTLSLSEFESLVNRCIGITGNLSGFGTCASCRSGALGAAKQ